MSTYLSANFATRVAFKLIVSKIGCSKSSLSPFRRLRSGSRLFSRPQRAARMLRVAWFDPQSLAHFCRARIALNPLFERPLDLVFERQEVSICLGRSTSCVPIFNMSFSSRNVGMRRQFGACRDFPSTQKRECPLWGQKSRSRQTLQSSGSFDLYVHEGLNSSGLCY